MLPFRLRNCKHDFRYLLKRMSEKRVPSNQILRIFCNMYLFMSVYLVIGKVFTRVLLLKYDTVHRDGVQVRAGISSTREVVAGRSY